MENKLAEHFCNSVRRYGCTAIFYQDCVEFENEYLRGKITLRKPFTVTWKCKRGYELLDVPVAVGNSSSQFDDVGKLLNFIQRRLLK